jgi:hypothetical protein
MVSVAPRPQHRLIPMGDFALIAFGTAAGLAVLILAVARAIDAGAPDWEASISATGRRELESLRRRFALEQDALDLAYERARSGTDPAEVAEMLAIGYSLVIDVSRDRRDLLQRAALYSRLISAMAPLPPLTAGAFRLRGLASRAAAAALAHGLLTNGARYRLRLAVLRRGLHIVLATMGRGIRPLDAPRWQELEAARSDWHTLSDETLESFRALVSAAVQVAPRGALSRPLRS